MKRLTALILLLIIFVTGCAPIVKTSVDEQAEDKPTVTPGLVTEVFDSVTYLVELDDANNVICQYGFETVVRRSGEGFTCSVSYPVGDIEEADSYLKNWANDTVKKYSSKQGELTVHYNSFVINDVYAGVKEMGWFTNDNMAHSEDIICVVNIDLLTGSVIDIYEGGNKSMVLELLKKDVADLLKDTDKIAKPDESWLKYSVLSDTGLEIVLPKGEFLPIKTGTKVLSYPYDEIRDALSLDFDRTDNEPQEEPLEEVPKEIDPSKPMVALTFDDGPSSVTPKILDLFSQYGGHATFCVVGNRLEKHSEIVNRIISEGHEIASHTWEHKNLTELSGEEAASQMSRVENKLNSMTDGYDVKFLRPPYGSVNGDVKRIAEREGLAIANWSVDTLDWKTRDAASTIETVKNEVKDGSIILFHDLYDSTGSAMETLIPYLIEEGYQLVTLSELLYHKKGGAVSGEVYRYA